MEKLTFNMTEAAETLGVSVVLMRRIAKTPGFPIFRVGKRILIPKEGLRQWINEQVEEEGE